MREPLNWNHARERKPLTPEKLMRILDKTEGGERAREVYRRLTGEEPPETVGDQNEHGRS